MPDASSSTEAAAPDPYQERAEQRVRMLRELAEIGMRLALALEQKAVAQAAANPSAGHERGGDPKVGFARLARAVRQTLALETRLDQEQRALTEKIQAVNAERRAVQERERSNAHVRAFMKKVEVEAVVERVIEAEAPESDVERLLDSLTEKLTDEADDADFDTLPLGELVARVCRDLGVPYDPERWEDEDGRVEGAGDGDDDFEDDIDDDGPLPSPHLDRSRSAAPAQDKKLPRRRKPPSGNGDARGDSGSG